MPSKHRTRVLGGFSGAAGGVVDGGRGAEGIWGELLNGEIQPALGVPDEVVDGGCIGGGCSWPGVGSISALEGWGSFGAACSGESADPARDDALPRVVVGSSNGEEIPVCVGLGFRSSPSDSGSEGGAMKGGGKDGGLEVGRVVWGDSEYESLGDSFLYLRDIKIDMMSTYAGRGRGRG